jgi:triphosphoribosyl-dephospho-CoA synthase
MTACPRERPARTATQADATGRLAVRSLYREVALHPKPGLVSPFDSGSHDDMDMTTFFRSLFALRGYFRDIARAGALAPPLPVLQALGISAEGAMLAATGGVNTHRGAIFNLGLLCAAAGLLHARGETPHASALSRCVADTWGRDILASRPADATAHGRSHGLVVARRHGTAGAREQAAAGFPDVIDAALPAYRDVLASGVDDAPRRAALQALFVLIARLDDSNLLWRGGRIGLDYAQGCARTFLAAGGVLAADWEEHAAHAHRCFVARRLSPGGAADLLAVTLLMHDMAPAEPAA